MFTVLRSNVRDIWYAYLENYAERRSWRGSRSASCLHGLRFAFGQAKFFIFEDWTGDGWRKS